jgi:hypothetical protein
MGLVSNCCGAYSEYSAEIDLCLVSMEHCDFEDDDEGSEDDEDDNLYSDDDDHFIG